MHGREYESKNQVRESESKPKIRIKLENQNPLLNKNQVRESESKSLENQNPLTKNLNIENQVRESE